MHSIVDAGSSWADTLYGKRKTKHRGEECFIYYLWAEGSDWLESGQRQTSWSRKIALCHGAPKRTIRVIQNNYYSRSLGYILGAHNSSIIQSVRERQWTCWSSLSLSTFSTCVCCVRAEDTKKFAALPAALQALSQYIGNYFSLSPGKYFDQSGESPPCVTKAARMWDREKNDILSRAHSSLK